MKVSSSIIQYCLACFLLSAIAAHAQEKIEWSASNKITLNDFKGSAPDPSTKQSLIARTGVESRLTGPDIKTMKNFNKQITTYFFPADSWILQSDKSRLTYFLTLFDLNEWMARELRKQCKENRKQVIAGQFDIIYFKVNNEFAGIREQYDQETDYGSNKATQQQWETKIHERLSSLSDFCKLCGSKK